MRLCSKSTSCNRIPQLLLLAAVFYKKTTLMISIFGHKALHWQLRIVIPSGLGNCYIESEKKIGMGYGSFI